MRVPLHPHMATAPHPGVDAPPCDCDGLADMFCDVMAAKPLPRPPAVAAVTGAVVSPCKNATSIDALRYGKITYSAIRVSTFKLKAKTTVVSNATARFPLERKMLVTADGNPVSRKTWTRQDIPPH